MVLLVAVVVAVVFELILSPVPPVLPRGDSTSSPIVRPDSVVNDVS